MSEILTKPTRLYIKKCSHCDLKCFGKTVALDIEKYEGSGTVWKNHLRKHGAKALHIWNSDFFILKEEIEKEAINFSRENSIVESLSWANLKIETGLEGGWDHFNGTSAHLDATIKGGKNSNHVTKTTWKKGQDRVKELSKKANEVRSKKLKEDVEFRTTYYSKVSEFQKTNNSMKNRNWCIPKNAESKKCMKVFHKDEIPEGWITVKEYNEIKHDETVNKNNPSYGKMWIHSISLKQNRYIDKNDEIPEGWNKGRKMKF